VHDSIDLYEYDFNNRQTRLLSNITRINDLIISFKIFIEYWDKDKDQFYIILSGQDPETLKTKKIYLVANVTNSSLEQIEKEKYDKLTMNAEKRKGSFDWGLRGQWVSFDTNTDDGTKDYWSYKMYEKDKTFKVLIEDFDWLPYHYLLENN